jgi:hypothetical protein
VKFVTPEEEIIRRMYYYEVSKNILVVFDGDSYVLDKFPDIKQFISYVFIKTAYTLIIK